MTKAVIFNMYETLIALFNYPAYLEEQKAIDFQKIMGDYRNSTDNR